jgi:AcrR family transcriptional regulator
MSKLGTPRKNVRLKDVKRNTTRSPEIARKALREDARAFKREILIEAAIDIFYHHGYQTASVDDIAAAVSVTKAAVYYYFESKEALLQAIIERCSDLTVSSVERGIAAGESPATKLALACYCFATMVLENQKMIAVYFREERCYPQSLHERVTATQRDVTLKLAKVIDAGVRRNEFLDGDSQTLALRITGMISMSYYWYTEHGRVPKKELCRQFAVDALRLAGFQGEIAIDQWLASLSAA